MKLKIDGVEQILIPIKEFREDYDLTDAFGIVQFEPKDYEGLGSLDKAGVDMNQLRLNVFNSVPDSIQLQALMPLVDQLQITFQNELYAINDAVSLRDVEVEFAVAGFGDALHSMVYQMMPLINNKQDMPSFWAVYGDWLNNNVRVSTQVHQYKYHSDIWEIQIINHVYGRVGLQVNIGDKIIYLTDGVYVCPAEGFMVNLLKDVSDKIWLALK